jgi:TfoX/Sxy family transcriptional regulator of competence genes
MPYNKDIEERIEKAVSSWENTARKNMFGGVCHLLNGNMFCGVYKDFLILRLGEEKTEAALKLPHVRPFDITGRPMKGWVMVQEEGFRGEKELKYWLGMAKAFAKTLPPK